jgi:tetratricopeptide (TPR) repeat protein
MQFVDNALRNLAERPLFVLALCRPEIDARLLDMFEAHAPTTITLGPLTRKASDRLVRAVLGADLPQAEVDELVARAAGNAFYLEELIRAVAEGEKGALPETVLAMTHSRIEKLESDARRVLRAASLFGVSFWREGVARLVGPEAEGTLDEWLSELRRREWIIARPESRFHGTVEYTFRHVTVHEAAYAMLTAGDLSRGHQLAGEWLEEAGERDALALSEHYRRGGDSARAVQFTVQAARHALEGNDLQAVLKLTASGQSMGASGEQLGELHLLATEALRWRGEHRASSERAGEAMALLPVGSASWYRAVAERIATSQHAGDTAAMDQAGELLLGESPADNRSETMSARRIAMARAFIAFMKFNRTHVMERVLDECQKGLEEIRPIDPLAAGYADRALAMAGHIEGDSQAGYKHAIDSIEAFERAGDLRMTCLQRSNAGFSSIELGALDRAEEYLRGALATAERLSLPFAMAASEHNLGLALTLRGKLDEAVGVLVSAIALSAEQGNRQMEATSRHYLSLAYLRQGRTAEAALEIERSLSLFHDAPAARSYVLSTLSRSCLAQGDVLRALDLAQEAVRLHGQAMGGEEGEAAIRLALVEALVASGRVAEARAEADRAVERLLARADLVGDEELRRGFLENLPDHAATMALRTRVWPTP